MSILQRIAISAFYGGIAAAVMFAYEAPSWAKVGMFTVVYLNTYVALTLKWVK